MGKNSRRPASMMMENTSFTGALKAAKQPLEPAADPMKGPTLEMQEGAAIGAFYGYQTSGDNPVFATEAEANAAGLKTWNENKSQLLAYHAGDIYFVDRNADGIIDEKDMGIIGDANPDLTGSIQNHFAYKQFALDILMTFSLGGDIYNYQRHELESMTGFYNQTVSVTNRWKSEGQQTATPRAVYGDPMGNSRFSDRFIEDGSYLKVREIC